MDIKENTKKFFYDDVEKILINNFGKKYTDYRKAWNLATAENIPNFPVHLDIEFYDICNQKCTFCPRNEEIHKNLSYEINTHKKIDENFLNKVMEESKKGGLMSVNFGAFAEPLIYKNIFKIVRKFHDIGVVDSRLITNALLLNKYNEEIFDSGLVNLYISIDAFSEKTYLSQRGQGYNKVIDNTLKFLDLKKEKKLELPIVRVSFVETDQNHNELSDFVDFWKDKVNKIDIQKKIDYTKDTDGKYNQKQWSCIDPFRRLSVISDGSILPCCSFWGRALKIGNISKLSLQDAWNSNALKKIREDLIMDKSSICTACQSE